MKFYIASGLANAEMVTALAKVLKARRWKHTYDWTAHGSVKGGGVARLTEVAENEMEGVRTADIIIVLLPGGRGTHAELGGASALNKPVFIWAESDEHFRPDTQTCAFYWNRNVTRVVGDRSRLLEKLFEWASSVEKVAKHV